jgi:K+-sensing histidine kinase KdpD
MSAAVPPGRRRFQALAGLLAGWAAVGLVTAVFALWIGTADRTTAALSYLLVVLVVAALSTLGAAVSTSILAFICFNLFFLPPVGTLRIDYVEDWMSLITLLAVSIVASQLAARARRREHEALAQRDELSRLIDERARLLKEREDAEVVRRSDELKSALLASLSHDLRTPLTAMMIAANNLAAASIPDESRKEQAEIVLAELSRLSRRLENLVQMARIEINAIAAEPEWVHPAEIVEAAVKQVEHALKDRPLAVDVAPDRALVQLDPRLTSAAVANLLENAALYSPDGSAISIQVTAANDEVRIEVRDRGVGIPSEDLERVFDRFYRGRNSDRHKFGTGMGLAITRGLVAAQRGRVTAEHGSGGGSVFRITLPARARSLPDQQEQGA